MTCSPRSSTACRPPPGPGPATGCRGWPLATLPGRGPATSRATWTSPRAWTAGTSTLAGPRAGQPGRTLSRTTRPPPTARPRSCPPTVPRPAGSAALVQAIYADDYRGATVTFSGEIRADPLTEQAGLRLEILRHWWRAGRAREDHGLTIAGRRPWTRYEITARIPADADLIRFGIALTGSGRIALRNPDLRIAGPDAGTP